jgi:hypothetical protein
LNDHPYLEAAFEVSFDELYMYANPNFSSNFKKLVLLDQFFGYNNVSN